MDSVFNFRGCYFHNFTIFRTILILVFSLQLIVLSNSTLFLRFDASKRQNSPSLWVKSLPWIDVNCGRQLDSMGEVIIQIMRKTPWRLTEMRILFENIFWPGSNLNSPIRDHEPIGPRYYYFFVRPYRTDQFWYTDFWSSRTSASLFRAKRIQLLSEKFVFAF